jgi:hypothetical protein
MRSYFLAGLLLSGCTFAPGQPFGVLEPTLRAAWTVPGDRLTSDGWARLNTDFQVRVTEARFAPGPLSVFAKVDQAAGFDPQNPPPGYSNCHAGHCHSDDGRLVPYEEIASGAGAPRAPVVVLRDPGELTLPAEVALGCAPQCELGFTTLARVAAPLAALRLSGEVRDGRSEARFSGARPFSVTAAAELSGRLELPLDGSAPPEIDWRLSAEPGPALFDDHDFLSQSSLADAVKSRLGELPLESEVNP